MKFLVMEDEFNALKGAFDYLNIKYYNGAIIIDNFSRTQDYLNISTVDEYDMIFVDISLQRTSDQDGYSFIRTLKSKGVDVVKKVIVVTGSDKVSQKLKEFNLDGIRVLLKPITFLDLKSVL